MGLTLTNLHCRGHSRARVGSILLLLIVRDPDNTRLYLRVVFSVSRLLLGHTWGDVLVAVCNASEMV